jgi:hypothetical protein
VKKEQTKIGQQKHLQCSVVNHKQIITKYLLFGLESLSI